MKCRIIRAQWVWLCFLLLLANVTYVVAQVVNFAPAVAYGSGGFSATSVAVADVNGDGKPDLLVANTCASYGDCYNGTVGVLLGNGDGTFKPAVTYPSGGYGADFIVVADVNGDGKLDLVVAHQCVSYSTCATPSSIGVVGVLLGNGDGTFQPALTYDSGGYLGIAVAVADVNGDGKPDLLVSNLCASYTTACSSGTVGVLLGNGNGTFQPAVTYGSGGYNQFGRSPELATLAVSDVNGDGKPDILVPNQCASSANCNNGTVGVLLGNGDGTFQAAVTYDSGGSFPDSVAVADVNGDGRPDLLVANTISFSVSVLLGNGDGTFQTAVSYYSGEQTWSVTAGDVNGAGKPDLVVPQFSGAVGEVSEVAVLLGNGNGTFQPYLLDLVFPSGGYAAAQAVIADVNGDGKPDLVVVNETPNPQGVYDGVVGVLINASGLVAPLHSSLRSTPPRLISP
ncbi:MAG: VCBS repeat-containing protein [Candidatus Sulfotelmatobacter sp.]